MPEKSLAYVKSSVRSESSLQVVAPLTSRALPSAVLGSAGTTALLAVARNARGTGELRGVVCVGVPRVLDSFVVKNLNSSNRFDNMVRRRRAALRSSMASSSTPSCSSVNAY